MNKSEAARIIARRLNLNAGRTNALLVAASDAGVLPKARGRDVPSLSSLELAQVLLACICDRGIGATGLSVREFAALQTSDGSQLVDLLEGWISGHVSVTGLKALVVQLEPAGVSVTTASHYLRYGASQSDGVAHHVVIQGDDLAAAILEIQGCTPREADDAVRGPVGALSRQRSTNSNFGPTIQEYTQTK